MVPHRCFVMARTVKFDSFSMCLVMAKDFQNWEIQYYIRVCIGLRWSCAEYSYKVGWLDVNWQLFCHGKNCQIWQFGMCLVTAKGFQDPQAQIYSRMVKWFLIYVLSWQELSNLTVLTCVLSWQKVFRIHRPSMEYRYKVGRLNGSWQMFCHGKNCQIWQFDMCLVLAKDFHKIRGPVLIRVN